MCSGLVPQIRVASIFKKIPHILGTLLLFVLVSTLGSLLIPGFHCIVGSLDWKGLLANLGSHPKLELVPYHGSLSGTVFNLRHGSLITPVFV